MFYVSAPSGHIALHTLEECILTRLEYLELLYLRRPQELKGNFEYLLEFSNYDFVGHFTLRLLAATSREFCHYWLTRETLLFKHRLNQISPRQFCRLFKSIARQVKKREKQNSMIDSTLTDVCAHYSQTDVKHFMCRNFLTECKEHPLKVNFEMLPKMVESREVELTKGSVIIYCSQWKEVLIELFQTFLESETLDTDFFKELVTNDSHLTYLHERLKFKSSIKDDVIGGHLTASNLQVESLKFPPCMKHLHDELRRNHRLSHYARFYYSLFLKECGMKIEEALEYWRNEYSKPHLNVSVCSHQWQKDSRKYTYSIKHMYGLEGSRKKYKSPTCNAICGANINANYEGGCPFKEFDKRKLEQILCSIIPKSKLEEFLKIAPSLQPRSACRAFLKLTCNEVNNNLTVTNPSDFYLAKNNV